jgi:hypothetical protein
MNQISVAANFLIIASTMIIAVGCSSGLPSSVKVAAVSTKHLPLSNKLVAGRTAIGLFTDSRPVGKMSSEGAKLVGADSETAAQVVASAVSDALRKKGVMVGGATPLTVLGDILEWHASIKSSLSGTKLIAQARFTSRVQDEASGKILYEATYSGERETRDAYARESRIAELLEQAMSLAIAELSRDPQLLAVLEKQ